MRSWIVAQILMTYKYRVYYMFEPNFKDADRAIIQDTVRSVPNGNYKYL